MINLYVNSVLRQNNKFCSVTFNVVLWKNACKHICFNSKADTRCLLLNTSSSICQVYDICWDHFSTIAMSNIKKVKLCIAVRTNSSPLQELTCHMGSHSVTCHPTEVTFLPLPPAEAGTRFSDPGRMQGCVKMFQSTLQFVWSHFVCC